MKVREDIRDVATITWTSVSSVILATAISNFVSEAGVQNGWLFALGLILIVVGVAFNITTEGE